MTPMSDEEIKKEYEWYIETSKHIKEMLPVHGDRVHTFVQELFRRWEEMRKNLDEWKQLHSELNDIRNDLFIENWKLQAQIKEREERIKELNGEIDYLKYQVSKEQLRNFRD